ncbi:MAG TPA: AAA family ATPase [Nitrososphaera sp.]|jgi:replication factor C large subunit|nr:AAA family ATPase [Nitrososphaera sp.]
MMWSEKYRPERVEQMVGNEDARLAAVKWLATWVSGSRPLLLVGPPGTGKTTLVRALVGQFGYDMVEMNASDTRNKEILKARIEPVFRNVSLFAKKILLFLDEVDGISGREDSGGLDTLVDLMKEPTVPVIMAANEKSTKIKVLAKVCKKVEFSPVPPRLLMLFLDHVLQKEGAKLGPGDKMSLVNNSGGDIRSLLNSTQSRVAGYATGSNKDVVEIDIAEAITGYFNSDNAEQAMTFISKADSSYPDPRYTVMTPEVRRKDMIGALFSSIVSSHSDHDSLAPMLDVLSKVDVHVGRANAGRQWRILRYIDKMVSGGLYEISRNRGIKYTQYSLPWPAMGPIFARSQSTRKILSELAPAVYTSKSSAGSTVMPYFIRFLIEEKVDPVEFAIDNFGDESVGESISKEIQKVGKK